MQQIFIYFVESIIYDIGYFIGSYKYYLIPLGQIGNILNKFNILTLLKLLHIDWMYSYMIGSKEMLQNKNSLYIKDFTILAKSLSSFSWLAEILEKDMSNFFGFIEGKGVWKAFGVFQNLTWHLFLYHNISFIGLYEYSLCWFNH